MTAEEARTAANNKLATLYTYETLVALIEQEANAGNFNITSNTIGYHKEFDVFVPQLVSLGYTIKTDYAGFIVISWN